MDLQSYIELKKKYASMQSPQPISEEVEELDEKFKISDLFTGDSEARRQLRAAKAGQGGTSGQGGSDTGYDPKTGTSRTASGRNVVVAPRGGKAGTMEPGKPDSSRSMIPSTLLDTAVSGESGR